MDDGDALDVWWGAARVGRLQRDALGRMGFRYDGRWLGERRAAVSASLPPRTEPFPPEEMTAHRFFANLLPEGAARARIARELKVPDTDFALLRAVGGECAGALSVLEPGRVPAADVRYRELDRTAFERFVRTRGGPSGDDDPLRRPRLSLAGAQDKHALRRRGNDWLEPLADAPSTHILKFDSRELSNVLVYEAFLSALARDVGLPVIDVELDRIGSGQRYLCVRRYDREMSADGTIERLHQEDFCQALGVGHERKYESDGGPTFADCVELVRTRSSDPVADVEQLLDWQILNVVAGNSDGHAKNLSLLHEPTRGVRLAPFYDLVCTRAIARIDTRLAFSVGGQWRPADIDVSHWRALARACDVGERFLVDRVRRMNDATVEALPSTRTAFEHRHGPTPALQRVERVIATQSRRIRRTLDRAR